MKLVKAKIIYCLDLGITLEVAGWREDSRAEHPNDGSTFSTWRNPVFDFSLVFLEDTEGYEFYDKEPNHFNKGNKHAKDAVLSFAEK